jgi:hypothetical protein
MSKDNRCYEMNAVLSSTGENKNNAPESDLDDFMF